MGWRAWRPSIVTLPASRASCGPHRRSSTPSSSRVRYAKPGFGRGPFPGERLRAAVHEVEHHLAHPGSAFLASPFDEAMAVSVDGFGDFAGAAWGMGRGGRVEAEAKVSPAFAGHLLSGADAVPGFPELRRRVQGDGPGALRRAARHGRDALDCFPRTQMDVLVMGAWVVERRGSETSPALRATPPAFRATGESPLPASRVAKQGAKMFSNYRSFPPLRCVTPNLPCPHRPPTRN